MGSYLYANGSSSNSKCVDRQLIAMIRSTIDRPSLLDNPFAITQEELAQVVLIHSTYIWQDYAYELHISTDSPTRYVLNRLIDSEILKDIDVSCFREAYGWAARLLAESIEYDDVYPIAFQWS